MKKTTTFLLFLLICLLPQAAWGDDPTYTVNGVTWKYGFVDVGGTTKVEIRGETMGAAAFSGALNIPDVIPYNGTNRIVGQIAGSAFRNYEHVTSVTIPNSVEHIEDGAFYGCSGLTSVTLPANLTKISSKAFYGCKNLVHADASAVTHLTEIGDWAFSLCQKLEQAPITNTVTKIGFQAFWQTGITEPIFPSSLTTIGDMAFSRCPNITHISVPSSVTNLGKGVFSVCLGLTDATLPANMTSVPANLFSGCKKLVHCNLSPNLTSIGDGAFLYCEKLTEDITPLKHVTSFGNSAFLGCEKLTGHLTFPEGTQIIGGAFGGCTGLTGTLTFPSTLKAINSGAFVGCTGLTGTLTFPDHLQTIGVYAFKKCTGLQGDVFIGKEIKTVGNEAFMDAGFAGGTLHISMQENTGASLGDEVFRGAGFGRVVVEGEHPIAIGKAFTYNNSFGNYSPTNNADSKYQIALTIAPDVKTIPDQAFRGLYVVGHVDVPATVTSVGKEAFDHCEKMTSITWPSNLTEIPFGCFRWTGLTTVSLSNTITKIGDESFWHCLGLRTLSFTSSPIKYIGDYAFRDCLNLEADAATLLPPTIETLGSGVFVGCHGVTGEAVLPSPYQDTHPEQEYRQITNPMVGTGCYAIKMGPFTNFFQPGKTFNQLTQWMGSTYQTLLYIDARNCTVALTNGKNEPNTAYKFSREMGLDDVDNTYCNFGEMAMNALVYLPSESVFLNSALPQKTFAERFEFNSEYPNQWDAKGENFIMDGKCQRFYVQDGLDYRVPYAFTAIEARCSRVFSGTSCKTLYLPYATNMPTGLRAYKLTDEGGQSPNAPGYDHTFIFTSIPDGTPLEANKPYLVRVTDGQEHRLPVMHNVEVPVSPDMQTTADMATFNSHWKFMGTTEKVDNAKAASLHAYNLKNNVWYPITSANTNGHIDPFRCFVSGDGTAPAKLFAMVLEGETDGIDNIADVKASEADVRSGRYMFYTLDGKSMGKSFDALPSGEMYVVNGKKFYKF